MATIKESVYDFLPFFKSPDQDIQIDREIERTQILLQTPLKKDDMQVHDEGQYTKLENLLVAQYTAYVLANRQALRNTAGEEGNAPNPARYVKKAEAGSVSTEFTEPSSKNSLVLSAEVVEKNLKDAVCITAAELGVSLKICGCVTDTSTIYFNVYQ